ncbi:hypothetical protein PT974_01779 [Cladobotryum mycophilum]|uniref:Uncharacterized protein n=1 Tax=Cladobotryum mycophilum TaxID=491253 RepID=A0ABR0SW81_9HYPO
MCHSDISLEIYSYLGDSKDVTARSWAFHQCVDFDTLKAWTRERAIDIFHEGVLAKPEDLGPEHVYRLKLFEIMVRAGVQILIAQCLGQLTILGHLSYEGSLGGFMRRTMDFRIDQLSAT